MKEIDFLPQWYKDKRRRQGHYRAQYLGLASLLIVMAAWTAVTTHSICKEQDRLDGMTTGVTGTAAAQEFAKMKNDFETLHVHTALLSRIDQHVRISGLLGELSAISGNQVKFSRLYVQAEKQPQQDSAAQLPSNTIRAVRDVMTDKTGPYDGDIRFKVTIAGIASDATYVAGLIRRLEQSAWFFKVTPSFCKNSTVSEHVVSEFEIICYIANYTETRTTATRVAVNSASVTEGKGSI
jgi:hypothetical protein